MKTLDVKKDGYKGEYYASVEFAKMDGGNGEYSSKNLVTKEQRWEVVTQNPNGSFNVRDMSEKEYKTYKNMKELTYQEWLLNLKITFREKNLELQTIRLSKNNWDKLRADFLKEGVYDFPLEIKNVMYIGLYIKRDCRIKTYKLYTV